MSRSRKEYEQAVDKLLSRGWQERSGKNHRILIHPSGERLIVGKTSVSTRGISNMLAMARRIERGAK